MFTYLFIFFSVQSKTNVLFSQELVDFCNHGQAHFHFSCASFFLSRDIEGVNQILFITSGFHENDHSY